MNVCMCGVSVHLMSCSTVTPATHQHSSICMHILYFSSYACVNKFAFEQENRIEWALCVCTVWNAFTAEVIASRTGKWQSWHFAFFRLQMQICLNMTFIFSGNRRFPARRSSDRSMTCVMTSDQNIQME